VQEYALDAFPNSLHADAALRRLSLVLHDLEPYDRIARRVGELLDLSQKYLFEIMPGGEDGAAARLHEKALAALDELAGRYELGGRE
jgi:hypothetical protein